MDTHRIETALIENGKLSLKNLPFKKRDEVEVMIMEKKKKVKSGSLKGTVIGSDMEVVVRYNPYFVCIMRNIS